MLWIASTQAAPVCPGPKPRLNFLATATNTPEIIENLIQLLLSCPFIRDITYQTHHVDSCYFLDFPSLPLLGALRHVGFYHRSFPSSHLAQALEVSSTQKQCPRVLCREGFSGHMRHMPEHHHTVIISFFLVFFFFFLLSFSHHLSLHSVFHTVMLHSCLPDFSCLLAFRSLSCPLHQRFGWIRRCHGALGPQEMLEDHHQGIPEHRHE